MLRTYLVYNTVVWRVRDRYYDRKKKVLVVCLAGARCIEFECNEFVLVLVQIDLIHFKHSIFISST